MKWRLVQIEEKDERKSDLSNDELIAASIALNSIATGEDCDVYFRAWDKLQQHVTKAIDEG